MDMEGRRTIYLDHAATTPLHPEVKKAMEPFLQERFGNPSTLYSLGREAREAVEQARERVANLIGALPDEIVFTSGGTEACNMAMVGAMLANQKRGKHLITTKIEHHAVLDTAEFLKELGFEVTYLPVDKYGLVDPDDVKKAIRKDTVLVSVMHANNEVGTIEPIEEIAKICREREVLLFTDAVQTVGLLPVDVDKIGVDLLSMSAHKFYGPKGVGALYIRKGVRVRRIIQGGDQERELRAGTENVAGIVGMGVAAELAKRDVEEGEPIERIRKLRDMLKRGIEERLDGIRFNGHPERRLPNNLHICVERAEGEAMVLRLDLEGICCSTGSACTSRSLEPSHVLVAMGIPPELAHGSLRFTLGKGNTEEEIERTVEVLAKVVKHFRAMAPAL